MRGATALFTLSFLLLFIGGHAFADDLNDESSLRCESHIIDVGTAQYEVKQKCGEPSGVEENGDLWVYNFGPGRFVYYLTFLEGKLIRIQSGGYGQ